MILLVDSGIFPVTVSIFNKTRSKESPCEEPQRDYVISGEKVMMQEENTARH